MRAFLANLIANSESPLDLEAIGSFCPSEANIYWYQPFLKGGKLVDFSEEALIKMRPLVHHNMLQRTSNHLPLKTHSQYGTLYNTPLITAQISMGAIYIIRDPRDVVLSGMHHFNLTQQQMIEFMRTHASCNVQTDGNVSEWLGKWSDHAGSWAQFFPKPKLILRYEDLLKDPILYFSKVAKWLNITQDQKRIDKAVEFSSFKQMKAMEADTGFSERPDHVSSFFRAGKSGEWRDRLAKADIKQIQADHGAMMKQFNYDLI